MASTPRLLFVCSGNLHRSVMAAAMTRAMFEELKRPVLIASAGTLNIRGRPAPQDVVIVCDELGIDVREHRSQGLSRSLIQSADLVIVMEEHHGDEVLKLEPGAQEKLIYLGDWTDPPGEVFDPIGKDLATFRLARDIILKAIQAWLPTLIKRLE